MAVALVIDLKGATSSQYDAAMQDLDLDGNPPAGIRYHVAGPIDGGWRVVDIWESEADFHNFVQSRLGATMQKLGIPQPQIAAMPVHNTWQPPA